MKSSIDSIETFGLVDGPGIRTVIFFRGCHLRCLYCHNPEMWKMGPSNYTVEELLNKVRRNKPYFKRNNGGVTLSGGEPLLQVDFLLEFCKKLKEEKIHIALDTAGVGTGKYKEILELVDLVIFDVKYATTEGYLTLTKQKQTESERFLNALNESGKPVWIRQVIVPNMMDNQIYLKELGNYLKKINNIEKIEFLPFHHLGFAKYQKLGIPNPLETVSEMDTTECVQLYEEFMTKYYSKKG